MSSQDKQMPMNIAGWLAKTFLHTKITLLIMLAISLWGAMAVFVTPRLYNPEIVVPAASIFVMRPGYSPEEIQNQVVKPLESLMASIKGVEHTFGYAVNDMGVVTVQFEVGANEERSLLLLYNQLMRNMDRLTPGAMSPLVKSIGVNDVPILSITLSSGQFDGIDLRELGMRVLEQLRSVPDVGDSMVIGGQKRAALIDIDPQRLASAGLNLEEILKLLRGSNLVMPAGDLVNNNRQYALRVNAAFNDVPELGHLIIGQANQKPIFLKDIATVHAGPRHEDQYTTLAYGAGTPGVRSGDPVPAVTLAIGKRTGANAVTVANGVLEKLQDIEHEALPQGVNIHVTRDYGKRADDAVNTLMEHLSIAIAVVALILLIFLGWREAAIVTLTVPLTLFVVLGVSWMTGHTINRISLFALILSLGLLVDDGIVVIENIHRHIQHTTTSVRDFGTLIVQATNEIGNPTIMATMTVIVAFIPMLFVTGMMGPFMQPIPINVPVAMLTSLMMADVVVPFIALRWLRKKAAKHVARNRLTLDEKTEPPKDFLYRTYLQVFTPLLGGAGKRSIFFAVVTILLLLSVLMPAWQFVRPSGMNGPISTLGVNLQMLPDGNVDTFVLEVDTPAGTALEETNRVALAVGSLLAQDPYVTDYETYLGSTGPLSFAGMVRGDAMRVGANLAQIVVNIVEHTERPHTSVVATEIWNALAQTRAAFPEARIKLFLTPPGPPVRSQVLAELYGPDYEKLRQTAEFIKSEFGNIYGMINIDDSMTATAPEYLIHVDQYKAMLAGLAPAQVAKAVHDYVVGADIGILRGGNAPEPIHIIVRLKQSDRAVIQQILDLTMTNQQGKQVPLDGIVQIESSHVAKPIMDRDQHPVVYVMGDMLNASPVYATLTLDKILDKATLPNDVHLTTSNLGFVASQPDDMTHYQLLWGGDMRLTLDVFRDLGAAFIIGLVFIYLMLVAYYQSFMLPVIVMGAIPLTLIGIFPGHWLFNMPFNATSMIGFIALAGVVVRNSLLLIDFILDYRRQGYDLEHSVLEAGAVRFRPILLTALAIMLGSAVMISDPVFGGLALALIFGTFASTMLTLIVIPLFYYLWQRHEQHAHPRES
ncbi:Multidrug efflux pump subunit AcrB [Desulfuromusa kysingii]|uniref:Multidrug efflux pump subunit AcrB n=1 Tax=Desulfuromusa kysingii TaxID=37625 RepID=A0A1H4AZF3_9BACT|nr:efflux RND transporter permease subunit [Desulfuromusa kysingii]SEA41012.1 Multidrug efflux pump subunit AcrB [Desulfuromusa kysingii]